MKKNLIYILVLLIVYFIYRKWNAKRKIKPKKQTPNIKKPNPKLNKNVNWDAETVEFEEITESNHEK